MKRHVPASNRKARPAARVPRARAGQVQAESYARDRVALVTCDYLPIHGHIKRERTECDQAIEVDVTTYIAAAGFRVQLDARAELQGVGSQCLVGGTCELQAIAGTQCENQASQVRKVRRWAEASMEPSK